MREIDDFLATPSVFNSFSTAEDNGQDAAGVGLRGASGRRSNGEKYAETATYRIA
jgi:hypothetical protein